jgi:hypothetical protein
LFGNTKFKIIVIGSRVCIDLDTIEIRGLGREEVLGGLRIRLFSLIQKRPSYSGFIDLPAFYYNVKRLSLGGLRIRLFSLI